MDAKLHAKHGSVDARQKERSVVKDATVQNCTNTSQQTHNVTDMETMEDSPPDDLNEVMEWVFDDYQAERDSETEDDYDSD